MQNVLYVKHIYISKDKTRIYIILEDERLLMSPDRISMWATLYRTIGTDGMPPFQIDGKHYLLRINCDETKFVLRETVAAEDGAVIEFSDCEKMSAAIFEFTV